MIFQSFSKVNSLIEEPTWVTRIAMIKNVKEGEYFLSKMINVARNQSPRLTIHFFCSRRMLPSYST